MTRFARAKGSKASNEKRPEEATSWSELRKFALSGKQKGPGKQQCEEVIETENVQEQTEWAPLGSSDPNDSKLSLRHQLSKKLKEGGELEVVERKKKGKKKLKGVGTAEEKSNMGGTEEGKCEVPVVPQESDVKKRGEKRRRVESSEGMMGKKKRKGGGAVSQSGEISGGGGDDVGEGKRSGRGEGGGGGRELQWKLGRGGRDGSSGVEELVINGEKIKIVKFQGFYVTVEDAERLKQLRREMKREGIPREKLEGALKLERRRAEKSLSRLKKSVCFHCRSHGHLLSECPMLEERESTGTGICYKCGSGEHGAGECRVVRGSSYQFAECFICKEQGHIARQCPDNPRGLYPRGGGCRECGDVTHLRKDCPRVLSQKEEEAVTVGLRDERSLEGLDEEEEEAERKREESRTRKGKRKSAVKF